MNPARNCTVLSRFSHVSYTVTLSLDHIKGKNNEKTQSWLLVGTLRLQTFSTCVAQASFLLGKALRAV